MTSGEPGDPQLPSSTGASADSATSEPTTSQPTSTSSRRALQVATAILVLAYVLVHMVLVVRAYASASMIWNLPILRSDALFWYIGLALGNIGLGAAYLTIGRKPLLVRFLVFCSLIVLAGVVGHLGDSGVPNEYSRYVDWIGATLAIAIGLALVLLLFRLRGWHVVTPHDLPIPLGKPTQFSIASILSLTTCAGLTLGLARWLEFPIDAIGVVLAMVLSCLLQILASMMLLLERPAQLLAIPCLMLAFAVSIIVLYFAVAQPTINEFIIINLVSVLQQSGVMLILRQFGYRLHRTAT